MSVPLKKFWILQRDFSAKNPKQQFNLDTIKAKDQENAWGMIDESKGNTNTQEWLLTKGELKALKEKLCKQ
jgi:hypothetical protein